MGCERFDIGSYMAAAESYRASCWSHDAEDEYNDW